MPIGFDPNDTCWVKLDCVDKGREDRAEFQVRFLTARQAKQIEKLRTEAAACRNDSDEDAKLNEAIRLGIVGWKNLKDHEGAEVPFGDGGLDEFTIRQKYLITDEYPFRVRISEGERKNS